MTTTEELVVLVEEDGTPCGTADKASVHGARTPLHLAFSCHLFDSAGRVLLTRRALGKRTWPGVWSNSFCGHPAPGESLELAIARRAERELGIRVSSIEAVLPDFRYRAVDASGMVENEVCPVYRALTADAVVPRPEEVAEFAWLEIADLRRAVTAAPFAFSPWLVLQLEQWTTA